MKRRLIIRCIAATVCAGSVLMWAVGSIFHLQTSAQIVAGTITAKVEWTSDTLEVNIWVHESCPTSLKFDQLQMAGKSGGGFYEFIGEDCPHFAGFLYASTETGWKLFIIPLYFPSIVSALALAWVWRRTKRRNSATAFPVEPQQAPAA